MEPNRERVFKFPFKGKLMIAMLVIPAVELVLAIIATVVPLSFDEVADKLPMLIGVVVFIVLGEIVRVFSARNRKEEYKGLTPELAAARLAEEAQATENVETEECIDQRKDA